MDGTEDQKCPSMFFILCGYIEHICRYLYIGKDFPKTFSEDFTKHFSKDFNEDFTMDFPMPSTNYVFSSHWAGDYKRKIFVDYP